MIGYGLSLIVSREQLPWSHPGNSVSKLYAATSLLLAGDQQERGQKGAV
jgi:hypothetical protein